MLYKTNCIIIRQRNFSEADKIVTLISQTRGRVDAIVKSVRKPQSRKAGLIELGAVFKASLAKGKSLDIITEAQSLFETSSIKSSLVKIYTLNYILELTDKFFLESEQGKEIYQLLLSTIQQLENETEQAKIYLLKNIYEAQILKKEGYLFLDHENFKDAELRAYKIIKFISENPIQTSLNIKVKPDDLEKLNDMLYTQILNSLEKELKSYKLFQQSFKKWTQTFTQKT